MTKMLKMAEVQEMFGKHGKPVSDRAVKNWMEQDEDPLPVVRSGKRGQPNLFPLQGCFQWGLRKERKQIHKDADGEVLDHTQERARLAKSQRRKLEIETDVLRGRLLEREQVEGMLGAAITAARARLLSIPAKAAPTLVMMSEGEIQEALTQYIHDALNELAAASPESVEGPASTDSQSVGGPEADAKPRGQRGAGPLEH